MTTSILLPADEAAAIREQGLCPTCGAPMVRAGKRAWMCLNQRNEPKRMSAAFRAQVRDVARQRVPHLPF